MSFVNKIIYILIDTFFLKSKVTPNFQAEKLEVKLPNWVNQVYVLVINPN